MPTMAAALLTFFFLGIITVSFVSASKPITVPVSLRGQKLTGSVYIGNQAYDMAFGIGSSDVWVLGEKQEQLLEESKSFTRHLYKKSDTLKMNDANNVDTYFESAVYNKSSLQPEFFVTGKNAFEDISFQKNAPKDNSFSTVPFAIVDELRSIFKSVTFDYDGTFGLWPWKDDTPACPMPEWGSMIEAYTESCLSLFSQTSKASYMDNLPQKKYSIYLPSSGGDAGELMLGGYDAKNIDGEVACQPINRYRGSGSDTMWLHTYLSFEANFSLGKRPLTAQRKRKPISQAIIDIEVRGLQLPRPTLQKIMKQAGVKKMSVMPAISEEGEQHNGAHEKDEGYFIPCSRRSVVDRITFPVGKKILSVTGHDMFFPSEVNPSWCKMAIELLPRQLAKQPIIVLGDTFFKKYVTIFDFERGRGKTSMCVGTPKKKNGRKSGETLLFSTSSSNNSTGYHYDNGSPGGDGATAVAADLRPLSSY